MANSFENKRSTWVGEVENVHPLFEDCLTTAILYKEMQVEIAGNIVDLLEEHNLFSTLLHSQHGNEFIIILRHKPEYYNSNISRIHINFNRFNVSFILTDGNNAHDFGTFRFRTRLHNPTKCEFTGIVQYSVIEDEQIINELKEVFYIAEVMYNNNKSVIQNDKDLDFETMTMCDLCTEYTGSCRISTVLSHCGYQLCTVKEFVNIVDIKELRKNAGVGPKTCTVLNEIYRHYNLDELRKESDQ